MISCKIWAVLFPCKRIGFSWFHFYLKFFHLESYFFGQWAAIMNYCYCDTRVQQKPAHSSIHSYKKWLLMKYVSIRDSHYKGCSRIDQNLFGSIMFHFNIFIITVVHIRRCIEPEECSKCSTDVRYRLKMHVGALWTWCEQSNRSKVPIDSHRKIDF